MKIAQYKQMMKHITRPKKQVQTKMDQKAYEKWLDQEIKKIELARSTRKGGITDLI